MEQVLSAFGIDWRLLIFNSINFGLMLLALTYFLYKPLMRILDERRGKVAQGVLDAQAAEEKLVEVECSRQEVLAQAGFEADELLAHTRRAAAEAEREARARGEVAAASALMEAEMQAKELKWKALLEAKEETAKLVVLGVEKVMKERV